MAERKRWRREPIIDPPRWIDETPSGPRWRVHHRGYTTWHPFTPNDIPRPRWRWVVVEDGDAE